MKDFVQVADRYYVLASSVLADRETRVMKHGETFALFDRYGDIQPVTHRESGIFHRGTRHLSHLSFLIAGDERPLLLNSNLRDDNGILRIEMTNPDLLLANDQFLAKGMLHLQREKFLFNASCRESITVSNFSPVDVRLPAALHFAADFADTFEVRGMKRDRRGSARGWTMDGGYMKQVYQGLDGIQRWTCLRVLNTDFSRADDSLRFEFHVPARDKVRVVIEILFDSDSAPEIKPCMHDECLIRLSGDHHGGRRLYCSVETPNDQFAAWLRRSTDDLVMMTTHTEHGFAYPYAGIPWYCAAFGRDGILTAMETLWVNPDLARGTLGFLAATQATEDDADRDAQPGKIVHEIRHGEMANLREVPFGRYYGSADSTPLFLVLCGLYFRRTGDLAFLRSIWPAIEAALAWVDGAGDADGDGFVEYQAQTPRGLAQQGWKDSVDSVFHVDGSDAPGPIALCEVQAYVYLAKQELAVLAAAIGRGDLAARLRREASRLKLDFDRAFWLEELGTYALALDGDKKPCRVYSSNAGHCLFTGIVPAAKAEALVRNLMSPTSFAGWGVRTIDARVARYNPMSYHNGSIWPHDNALIAWGMARYGFTEEAERILEGLFKASTYMDMNRMPEVFCGFERRTGEAPTLYHHACAPQAWAAASVFLLLQAVLGLSIDASARRLNLIRPRLPEFLPNVTIRNLQVGDSGSVDLALHNLRTDVSVELLSRKGNVIVSVEK